MKTDDILRGLPSVNQLASKIQKKNQYNYPFNVIVDTTRDVLSIMRKKIIRGDIKIISENNLIIKVEELLIKKMQNNLRGVINCTGIVLHTNLGRAVLSENAQKAVENILDGYCNLEIDLETGKRGSRYSHVEDLLTKITEAEAALVVNNNAAAVFLTLQALAKGKEVIVSRGQLVEIGGSFRVPEILEASGASLVEVGTTNKTKILDYEQAITEFTSLLLKVHTSNYRILGFTEEVSVQELSNLGIRRKIPVVEDLGSGFLIDLKKFGITDEPTVQQSVMAGADIVTFSGDKLLGGPQAGIIVGKAKYIDIIKKHPLNRALRVDKITLATLEATLRDYLYGDDILKENPTLKMLTRTQDELKENAEDLLKILEGQLGGIADLCIEKNFSEAGGGSLPTTKLPTWVIKIKPIKGSVNLLSENLRRGIPAILARIEKDTILLDLRTIQEKEYQIISNRLFEEIPKE